MRIVLFNLVPYRSILEQKVLRRLALRGFLVALVVAWLVWEGEHAVGLLIEDQKMAMSEVKKRQSKVAEKTQQLAAIQMELDELRAQAGVLIQLHGFAHSRSQLFSVLSRSKPSVIEISEIELGVDTLSIVGEVDHLPDLTSWSDLLANQKNIFFDCEIRSVKQVNAPPSEVRHQFQLVAHHRLPIDGGALRELEKQMINKGGI